MSNKKPDPTILLAIASCADELQEMLREVKDNETPWNEVTLTNLKHDLHTVARLLNDEVMCEEWGITDEVLDSLLETSS